MVTGTAGRGDTRPRRIRAGALALFRLYRASTEAL